VLILEILKYFLSWFQANKARRLPSTLPSQSRHWYNLSGFWRCGQYGWMSCSAKNTWLDCELNFTFENPHFRHSSSHLEVSRFLCYLGTGKSNWTSHAFQWILSTASCARPIANYPNFLWSSRSSN